MKQFVIKLAGILILLITFFTLTAQNQIVGTVNYHDDSTNALPAVTLGLYDSNDNFVASTTTNNVGEYTFNNVPSGDYTILSSTNLPIGNIDLDDASEILLYLLGLRDFTDYEFAAADVNGSGNVTYGDYILVLVKYIMQGKPFPTDEWQFDEVTVSVSNSRDPITSAIVWATSTGDVEGIWQPGGRDFNIIPVNDDELTLIDNNEVELAIGSNYEELISGFNLNLVYPTNHIEIIDVSGPDDNFHFDLDSEPGVLKVIWLDENSNPGQRYFGETLFRVQVKQKDNTVSNMEGIFSLLEDGMILDSRSNKVEDLEIRLPKILTLGSELSLEVIGYPNPVVNKLNLKITSPSNTNASILIFDINGRIVKNIPSTRIFKGTQLIGIETESLTSGQYVYKINLSGKNIHGRFLK